MKLTIPKISLPSLLPQKTKVSLSVYITDRGLRILELNEDNKPTFEPVEVIWKGKSESEKLKILKSYVDKYQLRGKGVISCVPTYDGLLKVYKYPVNMSKKDIMQAINWAIKRELSGIKESALYDYYLQEPHKGQKNILAFLVFAREEAIHKLKDLIESAGLRLKILDYEVISIVNYGLYRNLPIPFSILYVGYNHALLVSYSRESLIDYTINWSYKEYLQGGSEYSLEEFFAEVRNYLVINGISNIYLAGPLLLEEDLTARFLENLPILGLLEVEGIKPNFFINYSMCLRGMEG